MTMEAEAQEVFHTKHKRLVHIVKNYLEKQNTLMTRQLIFQESTIP